MMRRKIATISIIIILIIACFLTYFLFSPTPSNGSGNGNSTTTIIYNYDEASTPSELALKEYKILHKQNEDVAFIMYIPDTGMDTPVMRPTEGDKYFRRNLSGEVSVEGVPFISAGHTVGREDSNAVIYGHRLDDYIQFGVLRQYAEREFYEKHPIIYTVNEEEETQWKIISVFTTDIKTDEFAYEQCSSLASKSQRETFIDGIASRSMYLFEYRYQEGDSFITLSTCHYPLGDGGRFVVVAVRQ